MMLCFHLKNSLVTSPGCFDCTQRKNGYTKSTFEEKGSEIKLQISSEHSISTHRGQKNTEDLELIHNLENNSGDLVLISDCVKKYRDVTIPLKNNQVTNDMYIRICGLDGTFYSGEDYMLENWQELYLPEPTKMEVLGILESSKGMPPFPHWVILVGEDGHVYGYGDKTLHLFAFSLKELLEYGIVNTGIYYDYPDDISDEEEEVLQKDEEVQRMRERTRKFIDEDGDDFNKFLELF